MPEQEVLFFCRSVRKYFFSSSVGLFWGSPRLLNALSNFSICGVFMVSTVFTAAPSLLHDANVKTAIAADKKYFFIVRFFVNDQFYSVKVVDILISGLVNLEIGHLASGRCD